MDNCTTVSDMRRCIRCEKEYPINSGEFCKAKNNPGGLSSYCKRCRSEKTAEYRDKSKKSITEKRCTACGLIKPASEFSYAAYSPNGLNARCRECISKSRSTTRRTKEQLPEDVKRCTRCGIIKPVTEFALRTGTEHRISHCFECRSNYQSERAKKHPEKYRVHNQRRQARKKSLPDAFTKLDWNNAVEYFGGTCAYCGSQQGLWNPICAEHVIPLSNPLSPGTVSVNIVPACKSCNSRKRSRNMEEWVIEYFGKRKGKQIIDRIKTYFASLA